MWKISKNKQLVLTEVPYILWHSQYLIKMKHSRGNRKELCYLDESMSDFPLMVAKDECCEVMITEVLQRG